MNEPRLTAAREQCLRDQTITDDRPGTVLSDFGVILDSLGPEGVEAGGHYHMLPIKLIPDLDSRLTRPLHLKSKRPQVRSHPYLQGLNLLLRASGLSRVDGTGSKARLVRDPEMMAQWDQLNPTERYFNLLEAWLRFGRPEMVGEWGSHLGEMLTGALQTWQYIPGHQGQSDAAQPRGPWSYGVGRDLMELALMDLFGFAHIEHPRKPVAPWSPAGAERRPFGDAVFALLFAARFGDLRHQVALDDDEDEEEEGPYMPRFGAWQPLFQPYFPEWRENLEFAEPELREGTFVFRVSVDKNVWRRIAISADDSLEDLVGWILRSVGFDSDHLYDFRYRDRMGVTISVGHPEVSEGLATDEVAIGELPLEPGESMIFRYDFGDNWRFDVKLERIEPPGAKIKAPRILEKHGRSPEQYPDSDW